jgi:protease-4
MVFLLTKKSVNNDMLPTNYIARIKIDENIFHNIEKINKLCKIEDISHIKAVVLHVNSPGGTTGGGEAYYRALKRLANKKPLIVVMDEIATSAAYMISLPAERIFALETSLTGSVGVILQTHEVTELMTRLGINTLTFKSSRYKAVPNMFEKTNSDINENVKQTIESSYEFFKSLLKKHRKQSEEQFVNSINGSVYIGRDALKLNLIDEIGDEHQALLWLKENKKIDLSIKDYHLVQEKPRIDNILKHLQSYLVKITTDFNGLMSKY